MLNVKKSELVNVYVKVDGEWHLMYKDVPQDKAEDLWMSAFMLGGNNISIETSEDRRIAEMNRKTLGL